MRKGDSSHDTIYTERDEIRRLARRFSPGYERFPISNSLLTRERPPGRHWLGMADGFRWMFLLHRSGFGYLAREGDETSALSHFVDFVRRTPSVPAYFHLYDFEPTDSAPFRNADLRWRVRRRVKFIYESSAAPSFDLGPEYTISRLGDLEEADLALEPFDGYRTFFRGFQDFARDGYCSAILSQDRVVSLCYTAESDGAQAEIDVATAEAHRGKGLASAVCSDFIHQSLQRGLKPAWDCFADNIPSARLAESLGFVPLVTYPFLSIFDPAKQRIDR